jgi:hypothetical protein
MERPSTPGLRPRDPLDTIPADSDALGQLRDMSRIDAEVDSLLAGPVGAKPPSSPPRSPQLTVPFELTRPQPIPLADGRAQQPSLPFELAPQDPVPLVRAEPEAFQLATARPRRGRYWLVGVAILVAVAAALATGGVSLETLRHLAR